MRQMIPLPNPLDRPALRKILGGSDGSSTCHTTCQVDPACPDFACSENCEVITEGFMIRCGGFILHCTAYPDCWVM